MGRTNHSHESGCYGLGSNSFDQLSTGFEGLFEQGFHFSDGTTESASIPRLGNCAADSKARLPRYLVWDRRVVIEVVILKSKNVFTFEFGARCQGNNLQ